MRQRSLRTERLRWFSQLAREPQRWTDAVAVSSRSAHAGFLFGSYMEGLPAACGMSWVSPIYSQHKSGWRCINEICFSTPENKYWRRSEVGLGRVLICHVVCPPQWTDRNKHEAKRYWHSLPLSHMQMTDDCVYFKPPRQLPHGAASLTCHSVWFCYSPGI